MPSREPRWCVMELQDGQWHPIPPVFDNVAEAEERKDKLLKKEEYQGKTLGVRQASYPVDPRKPPRRKRG
jgi:hypothetical protein